MNAFCHIFENFKNNNWKVSRGFGQYFFKYFMLIFVLIITLEHKFGNSFFG